MTLIDILLSIVLILFLHAVIRVFLAIIYSLVEDIDVDAEISEWIISKFKGDDEE